MSALGIYLMKPIDDESVFDNLCETLEDYGVEIVAPSPFDLTIAAEGAELTIAAPEDTLEELKEELENMDLLESANIVDSFEEGFTEEEDDDDSDFMEENF